MRTESSLYGRVKSRKDNQCLGAIVYPPGQAGACLLMKYKVLLPHPFHLLNTQLLGSSCLCNGIPRAAAQDTTVFTPLAIPYSNIGRIAQYNSTDSSEEEMALSGSVSE